VTVLVYDLETNALLRDELPDDHPAQPHPVQLAALLLDSGWRQLDELDVIVRPQGWIIPAAASRVHGISMERALEEGIPEAEALGRFLALAAQAHVRVAHNETFDSRVLRIALGRLVRDWDSLPAFCTMAATRDLCAIPPTEAMLATGRDWFKSPKLGESYQHLLGRPMPGTAHDAMSDCQAAADIFAELTRRGLVP
jgi:DNA polymerase-3 subunit epsilon